MEETRRRNLGLWPVRFCLVCVGGVVLALAGGFHGLDRAEVILFVIATYFAGYADGDTDKSAPPQRQDG